MKELDKELLKECLQAFWGGFKRGACEAPAFYFEPVIVSWRWLKRGAARLARAGWRPKVR